jgi:hypothetical protein
MFHVSGSAEWLRRQTPSRLEPETVAARMQSNLKLET